MRGIQRKYNRTGSHRNHAATPARIISTAARKIRECRAVRRRDRHRSAEYWPRESPAPSSSPRPAESCCRYAGGWNESPDECCGGCGHWITFTFTGCAFQINSSFSAFRSPSGQPATSCSNESTICSSVSSWGYFSASSISRYALMSSRFFCWLIESSWTPRERQLHLLRGRGRLFKCLFPRFTRCRPWP